MDPIFAAYEDRLIRRRRKPQTLKLFRWSVDKFGHWLEEAKLTASTVEPWQVEEFFAELAVAESSKQNVLQHVRSAYTYAHKRGAVALDPTYDVELRRPPDAEPVVISNSELRLIEARTRNDEDYLLFLMLAYTGMRRFEIAKCQWEDVNLKTEFIRVVGKQDKLRRVPIHPILGETLAGRRYHYGQPILRWVHWDRLHHFAPDRGFHDFRRTAATSLRRNGAQPQVIDRIFGWAPRGIMGRYYDHIADDEMRAAILLLYRDDPL